MNIKVIITKYNNKIMVACFEESVMISLSFYDNDEILPGIVYLCRIDKVLENINGSFIKYSKNCNGFYKSDNLKAGTILPLQLKREGTSNKEPLFTDKITLSSKFCVITKGNASIHVSSKIDNDISKELILKFKELSELYDVSVIIRTNAKFASLDEIKEDIIITSEKLLDIYKHSNDRTLYSELYRPLPGYIEELNNINQSDINEIITDNKDIYNQISYYLSYNNGNLKLYDDKLLSLYHLYKMDSNIKNATSRTILLNSGASIVIDNTEALIAIDVNTHYSSSKGNKEKTFLNTNKEAAKEIIRQLRIRNLSGMIIIDFINMKDNNHYKELFDYINELVKNDPVGIKIIDITELKLFELVRTKKRRKLVEQMR